MALRNGRGIVNGYEIGPGADLRGANLIGVDLYRADLTDADLTDADLTDADLTDADLTDAILNKAILNGAILYGADFTRAELNRAELQEANLAFARFDLAYLRFCRLEGADISDADFTDADLYGALGLSDEIVAAAVTTIFTGATMPEGGKYQAENYRAPNPLDAGSALTTYYRGGDESMEGVDRDTTVWDVVRFEHDELLNVDTVIPLFPAEVLRLIPANRTKWLARQRKVAQRYGRVEKVTYRDPVELVKDNEGGYIVIERQAFDFYTSRAPNPRRRRR